MAKSNPAKATKPLIPPEEALWQRYSPHFELPLAGATSLFLHGLGIGLLAMGGLAFFFTANVEATRPPRMDVVMIEGNGTGFEGESGAAGLPGSPDGGGKTEHVTSLPDQPNERPSPSVSKGALPQLDVPMIDDGLPPLDGELAIELQKIAQEAEERVNLALKIDTPKVSGADTKKPGLKGTGNAKGVGGLGGSGTGTGVGNKKGAGTGAGGPPGGRKGTQQEVYAWRWRFDLSGDAKEHARKLAALGVTVAIPDANPAGGFSIITDLNRRPVEMKRDNLAAFKDAVKWYNTRPESVQALAAELQIPTPKFVVLLLPKDREQKMAEEEAQFASKNRRDLKTVSETWFDFQRNGANDPVVIRQK
jgi:hypothetical protein